MPIHCLPACLHSALSTASLTSSLSPQPPSSPPLWPPSPPPPPSQVRTSGPAAGSGYEIILQGFNWESSKEAWYKKLSGQAADIAEAGFTAIWFPPPSDSVAPQVGRGVSEWVQGGVVGLWWTQGGWCVVWWVVVDV